MVAVWIASNSNALKLDERWRLGRDGDSVGNYVMMQSGGIPPTASRDSAREAEGILGTDNP
jgi:hypothetical protein